MHDAATSCQSRPIPTSAPTVTVITLLLIASPPNQTDVGAGGVGGLRPEITLSVIVFEPRALHRDPGARVAESTVTAASSADVVTSDGVAGTEQHDAAVVCER